MAFRIQKSEICSACNSVIGDFEDNELNFLKYCRNINSSMEVKRFKELCESEKEDLKKLAFNYPETIAKDTKEEGNKALNAAFECKEILAAAEKPIDIAKKIKTLAIRKSESTTNSANARCCDVLAKYFEVCEKLASIYVRKIDFVIEHTENAGNVAIALAENVLSIFNHYNIFDFKDQIPILEWALKNAKDRNIEAKKAAYSLLKSMKNCCERTPSESFLKEDSDDQTSPLIARDQPTGYYDWMMIVTIIIGIFGCAMFNLNALLNTSRLLKITLEIFGFVAVMWVIVYSLWKIFSNSTRRKRLSEFNKRDELIQSIEEQLSDLREYFEQNNIKIPYI